MILKRSRACLEAADVIFIDADDEWPGGAFKRRPGWPVRSEVAPANGTIVHIEERAYASWLNLIVTIRRWAGAIDDDVHSNRAR